MRHRKFDIQLFEGDAQIIDRTGAASLIPEENAREIIQGVVTQSAERKETAEHVQQDV